LVTSTVHAGPPPAKERTGPTVEELFLRFTLFDQRGRGFQSKAGPPSGPGSEDMLVLQPIGQLGIRQRNPAWSHQITFALDVVTAASPDGLDAISSASRYGMTLQSGTLETTWNSVYIEDGAKAGCPNDVGQSPDYDCPNREPERFPRTRLRHALAFGLNQHIPRTKTTLKVGYRFYDDDFDLRAHTPFVMLYQWLGRRVYLRALYRYHRQRGVSFYTTATRTDFSESMPLSADSDLAPFTAHGRSSGCRACGARARRRSCAPSRARAITTASSCESGARSRIPSSSSAMRMRRRSCSMRSIACRIRPRC